MPPRPEIGSDPLEIDVAEEPVSVFGAKSPAWSIPRITIHVAKKSIDLQSVALWL
jgi:hypothetical protein